MGLPEVLYTKTPDGAHLAYQVFGDGPFDLVFVPGFASNVEQMWRIEPFPVASGGSDRSRGSSSSIAVAPACPIGSKSRHRQPWKRRWTISGR